MTPILSICIPTYNRASYLKESLARLAVELKNTNEEIEVLISDNCSTDETELICREYAVRFPSQIVYIRQNVNIGASANFTYLLKHARGEFIKLQNDNFILLPGAVGQICKLVRDGLADHPVLFWGNNAVPYEEPGIKVVRTHDEFLKRASFYTTWIGAYGVWKRDLPTVIPIQDKYADSCLQQVAVLWTLFEQKRLAIIDNNPLFDARNSYVAQKGGYNIAEVFSQNYLSILKNFRGLNRISDNAFEHEKKVVFKWFIWSKYFDVLHSYSYKKGRYFYYTRDYHLNLYYWLSFIKLLVYWGVAAMPTRLRRTLISLYSNKLKSILKAC